MTNNDASVTTDSIHSKTLQPLHEPLSDVEMTLPQSYFAVMKNVVVVGFAFLLLFTSFQSIQNLQSSLNEEENIGLISLIIVYTSLIISCMFVPPMLISRIGCKWTLVASMSCYVAYIAANYYPRWYTLGFTSVLLGFGAAPLWSSKCAYLTTTAISHAKHNSIPQDVVITRFFGIFFMIFQSAQVWGNLISSEVLKQSEQSLKSNFTNQSLAYDVIEVCGANDCGQVLSQKNSSVLIVPEKSTVVILVTIYLVCGFLSIAATLLFVDQLKEENIKVRHPKLRLFVSTLRHLQEIRMLLVVPLTIYSGLEQGFVFADFTKSFVTCVYGIDKVGYVMICFGVGNSIFSYLLGKLAKYIGRLPIFISGAVTHLVIYVVLLSYTPDRHMITVPFVIAALWGYADAVWQTQINAFYGVLFHDKQEAAFSNYRLWESLGFVISFALSSAICVRYGVLCCCRDHSQT
ncbi:protein unc-93 homolog A-like isoform X2 [Xenia sp. Carnegie-2017]|uniref:protein unc-93 homolog A-like isoform X2 n=1 Tax=Xenia sp. Carnegie-2017 TaxID=2897299 RepID=UPI001F037C5A|nr:protein unc-93 homolog A-like isoform X2 [Xenia sp. Carnegie-2017]